MLLFDIVNFVKTIISIVKIITMPILLLEYIY